MALFSGALAASAGTLLTFQVDMSTATFDPGTQFVSARGSFGGWDANPFRLTNNPSGPNPAIWSGTTNVPQNNLVIAYKYTIDPGPTYESSHNRLIRLPTTSGSSISVPLSTFNDAPASPSTISVTFRVNMAQQINTGAFLTNSSLVYTRGGFNGWGTDFNMTNDPTILTTNQFNLVSSNVYVYTYDISGSPGQTIDYKHYIDTGANWESPGAGVGDPNDNNNRFFNLANTPTQVLPIIYFNDAPYSPVATNATKFQVDMSAQILDGNFDPSSGIVEVRGNFNSWGTPQILATNDLVNTNIYIAVVPLTDGVGAVEQYKFWASVPNNGGWETINNRTVQVVSGNTHVLDPVYFDNVAPNLGSLTVDPPSGGTVLVSWPAKPGAPDAFLQTRTNLATGTWEDHPETVGLTSTNYPIGAGQNVFFRTIRRR